MGRPIARRGTVARLLRDKKSQLPSLYCLFCAPLLRSPLSTLLFDRVRTPEAVRSVLEGGVYQNGARVDDELVRMLTRPG